MKLNPDKVIEKYDSAIAEVNRLLDNINEVDKPISVTKKTVDALTLALQSLKEQKWTWVWDGFTGDE